MPAMLRQLDSVAFYLAVWCGIICPPTPSSTAGCATQVYRNIAAKGPSIARHYPSDTETPFANIDVDIRSPGRRPLLRSELAVPQGLS